MMERGVGQGIDIYRYQSYRVFLREHYESLKKSRTSFSYRSFARKAGLKSSNYLKLVMDGQRRISEQQLPAFIKGLSLKDYEASYFAAMTRFEHAENSDLRDFYAREMTRIKAMGQNSAKTLKEEAREMLSHPLPWILREMFSLKDAKASKKWIQNRLRRGYSEDQIEKALGILISQGLLIQNGSKFVAAEPIITTGDQMGSKTLKNLHAEFFEMAKKSIYEIDSPHRRIGGLTLAIKQEDLGRFMAALKRFMSDLNRNFTTPEEADHVYQLSLAFFPLTKAKES